MCDHDAGVVMASLVQLVICAHVILIMLALTCYTSTRATIATLHGILRSRFFRLTVIALTL